MLISGVIGIPPGLLCGYTRGWLSEVIDALIDIFMTLPMLPLMLIVSAIMGTSITNMALILGIFSRPQLLGSWRSHYLELWHHSQAGLGTERRHQQSQPLVVADAQPVHWCTWYASTCWARR